MVRRVKNISEKELQLSDIHENLQVLNHSNTALHETFSNEIHQLTAQASEISKGINTNVMDTLKTISESTALMSTNMDSLKMPDRASESKSGFFKKMIRK